MPSMFFEKKDKIVSDLRRGDLITHNDNIYIITCVSSAGKKCIFVSLCIKDGKRYEDYPPFCAIIESIGLSDFYNNQNDEQIISNNIVELTRKYEISCDQYIREICEKN